MYSHRYFWLQKLSSALKKKGLDIMLSSRHCKRKVSEHKHVVERVWKDSVNEYSAKFLPKCRKQMKSEITRLYCDIMDNLFHQIPDFFLGSKIGIKGAFQKKKNSPLYTGCPRRNVPDFGRVFLMLKYTDITQNTYVQSWTVNWIMAREKCGLLAGPRTVPVSWQSYPFSSLSVV